MLFCLPVLAFPLKLNFLKGGDARCLDGSDYSFYTQLTGSPDTLVYLEPGGTCFYRDLPSSLNNCSTRSMHRLGSSRFDPEDAEFPYPILSNDSSANKVFANYNKVFGRYCDGAIHQGFISDPVYHNGKLLYFRGSANTIELFKWVKANNLTAGRVVLAGSSAGAVASLLWGNFLSELVGRPIQLIVDCGVFLDLQDQDIDRSMNKSIIDFTQFEDINKYFPLPCSQDEPDCLEFGSLAVKNKQRVLLLQSLYDQWNLVYIQGLSCVASHSLAGCDQAELSRAHRFRAVIGAYIDRPQVSYFAIGCLYHMILQTPVFSNTSWKVAGSTVQDAVGQFLSGNTVRLMDSGLWPSNSACSGAI